MSKFIYQSLYKYLDALLPSLALTLLIAYACISTDLFGAIESDYVGYLPKGQVLYVTSKAMGLFALGVAGLQILVGYTPSKPSIRLHAILGFLLVVFVLSHWLLFSLAVSMRTGVFPWQNLKLWSDGAFYHTGIMFGSLAFWLLIIIAMTGFAAKKRVEIAKNIHRLGFMVFVLAWVHALMIGTEAQMFWGQWLFISFAFLLAIAMFRRWFPRLFRNHD